MISKFESAAREWGAEVSIDHHRHYRAYSVDTGSEVVQIAQRAAKTMGFSGDLRTTLGGSDANIYNAKGVPCVVLGTGMEKIHTHDEFISRKDLIDTARLTYQIVLEAAKS